MASTFTSVFSMLATCMYLGKKTGLNLMIAHFELLEYLDEVLSKVHDLLYILESGSCSFNKASSRVRFNNGIERIKFPGISFDYGNNSIITEILTS